MANMVKLVGTNGNSKIKSDAMKKFRDFSPFGINFSEPVNDFFSEISKVEKQIIKKQKRHENKANKLI